MKKYWMFGHQLTTDENKKFIEHNKCSENSLFVTLQCRGKHTALASRNLRVLQTSYIIYPCKYVYIEHAVALVAVNPLYGLDFIR